ncbi:MAG: iron-containing redox enzyme family protein [Hydrogenophaga sp.]|uniref:iron-containing redox enzyme family protein n=1 Tax=Hydrogenophaga sp. TaxID=1904254 RepID=UPI0025BA8C65|nr:iron-containing redox enzyme family protein [Hydrogenophaga sp.]MBU7575064.1 iron-containing redox enzyme family protein [Hydrogenophaga sp.]
MGSTFIENMRTSVDAQWGEIKQGVFWCRVMERPVTLGFYRDLMLQMWHHSRHNAMNQAVATFVPAPEALLKFFYRQAAEELGHERMVVHDLKSIGIYDETDLNRPPLPATEALIGYLYYVGLRYGAVARLGYSFWAERSHDHVKELIAKISDDLNLAHQDVTFFSKHAQADLMQAFQVEQALERFAISSREQELARQVATTSLFLTGQLLNQAAVRHL